LATEQNDILRIVLNNTYGTGGQDMLNVWHFKSLDLATLDDAQLLVDIGVMVELIVNDIHAIQADVFKYVSYEVTNVTQDQQLGTLPYPTFSAGAVAAEVVTPQISVLTIMDTIKPRVQGRVFMGGLQEGGVSAGLWLSAVLDAAADMGLELLTAQDVTDGRLQYVVFNREFGTAVFPVGAAVITAARTQRRRSTGFGS